MLPRSLLGLGVVQLEDGEYEQGCRQLRAALELSGRQRDWDTERLCLRGLGRALRKLGRYAEAKGYARRGLALAEKRFPFARDHAHALLGEVLKEQSKLEAAERHYQLSRRGHSGYVMPIAQLDMGDIADLKGSLPVAREHLTSSLASFEQCSVF